MSKPNRFAGLMKARQADEPIPTDETSRDMERSPFIRMDFPLTDDLHAVEAFEHGPWGSRRPISVTDDEFRRDRNQGLSKPLRAGTPQGGRQMPGLDSPKGAHVKAGRGSKDRFPSGAAHCLEKPMDPFPIRMIRIPVGPLLIQPSVSQRVPFLIGGIQVALLLVVCGSVSVSSWVDTDKGEFGSVLDQPRIAIPTLEPMDIFGQPIIRKIHPFIRKDAVRGGSWGSRRPISIQGPCTPLPCWNSTVEGEQMPGLKKKGHTKWDPSPIPIPDTDDTDPRRATPHPAKRFTAGPVSHRGHPGSAPSCRVRQRVGLQLG